MIIFLAIIVFLFIAIYIFMQQPPFGSLPAGEQLNTIKRSPNYKDGQFQNIHTTPQLTEGASMMSLLWKFFFVKNKNSKPPTVLPSKKTDLFTLDPGGNFLTWFGHSSYYLQVDGKKILVDPVFSGSASPLSFTTKSYPGSDVYSPADFPVIDYLFISHDHWDHLDYKTIVALKPKIKLVITGIGTGAHFVRWGFDKNKIIEKDWNQELVLDNGFKVNTIPARHFSGRTFKRNQSLWLSFVLQTPSLKLFLGGDSGYDDHFKKAGERFGPFDIAILECGQYNIYWKYIHMMPEETVQAGIDLNAKRYYPFIGQNFHYRYPIGTNP